MYSGDSIPNITILSLRVSLLKEFFTPGKIVRSEIGKELSLNLLSKLAELSTLMFDLNIQKIQLSY